MDGGRMDEVKQARMLIPPAYRGGWRGVDGGVEKCLPDQTVSTFPLATKNSFKTSNYQIQYHTMPEEEFHPSRVVGQPYRRGLLPYGGGVGPDGRISFALTREEMESRLSRYRELTRFR